MTRKIFVIGLICLLLVGLGSSPWIAKAETPSAAEFVEYFIKLPLDEDIKSVEEALSPNFIYRDERVANFQVELDAENYIASLSSDWHYMDTLDIKVVTIREETGGNNDSVSVSAYYDEWVRDDFGIMGPLRIVYHFELEKADDKWEITKLIWAN